MINKSLTYRQWVVFEYIKRCIDKNGFPPSIREMMKEMKFSSTNGIRCHLRALEKKGFIKLFFQIARGIKIIKEESYEVQPMSKSDRESIQHQLEKVHPVMRGVLTGHNPTTSNVVGE